MTDDDRHDSETMAFCQICHDVYDLYEDPDRGLSMICGHTLDEADAVLL